MSKGPTTGKEVTRIPKKNDRMPVAPGSGKRAPLQFDSRPARRTGEVLNVASPDVVTVPPTTTIMGAIKTMTFYGFSRLPIADAGTRRLIGFVTSVDIVDFLGGGLRHNLLREKFGGNIFTAINADIREIMSTKLTYASDKSSLNDVLKLMYEKNVGGLPIVDEETRIEAIITEEDFVRFCSSLDTGLLVESFMSPNVVTAPAQTTIEKMTRMIIQKGFRRMPVVQDGVLMGMVTASDIMKYLGSGDAFEKVVTGDIAEVMNQPIKSLIKSSLIVTEKRADLGAAAKRMMDNDIGSLPVLDRESLAGILTERDYVRALAENRGILS
ncbi:MAG: Inosine-5'-monophosphate dehydrogenase [Methanosaeta sp. PtaB.Bin018]|jgi:CBS domain-containing protein|nr:MAG: Inosine-5'-monophosphate dehydrogenase [Methanosaeta sp. PtaB.Bin018]